MPELADDIESLKALIQQLLEKNAQLEAENAELRRRLGLDSNNTSTSSVHRSHKPPSSDGLKKKTTQPGLPKNKSGTNGGQPGHKGNTLKRVANPDVVKVHLPQQCQCCGRPFSADEAHEIIQSRQVFDLPEPKLEVTEHRLAQVECCGHIQHGEYPPEVTASVQYGPGVRALVTKLSVDHKTCAELVEVCRWSKSANCSRTCTATTFRQAQRIASTARQSKMRLNALTN